MELIVLDTSLKMLSVLDTFESLIWTERYSAYGDFEVYTSINDSVLEILKDDYYLWLKESDQTMIVEDRKIESDAENGNHFTVTGRSLESILERRIIWKQTILSGNFQNGIKKLLDENIIYEEGKYYFMMKVRWLGAMTDDAVRQKVGDSWKTEGLDPGLAEKFGPLLLSRRDRILREYLEWMLTERKQIVGRMEQKADADNPRTICRRQEIADEITLITRALDWYDNGKEADCI